MRLGLRSHGSQRLGRSPAMSCGSSAAKPLIGRGWTFGDFELRFNWSVGPRGAWKLALPIVSQPVGRIADRYASPRLDIALDESDSCGTIADGARILGAGRKPGAGQAAKAGEPAAHSAMLRRAGEHLSLEIDGAKLWDVPIEADTRFGLGLSIAEGTGTIAELTATEPAGESIYTGMDLSGWWMDRNPRGWQVKNGELVCMGGPADYIRTEREYENFTFSFEYNLHSRANSGIGIRIAAQGWPSSDGIELQLYDEPLTAPFNRHSTMALYGNLEPFARADRPDQWSRAVVKAEGYLISGWINGVLVQHTNTNDLPELQYRDGKRLDWLAGSSYASAISQRTRPFRARWPRTRLLVCAARCRWLAIGARSFDE